MAHVVRRNVSSWEPSIKVLDIAAKHRHQPPRHNCRVKFEVLAIVGVPGADEGYVILLKIETRSVQANLRKKNEEKK